MCEILTGNTRFAKYYDPEFQYLIMGKFCKTLEPVRRLSKLTTTFIIEIYLYL